MLSVKNHAQIAKITYVIVKKNEKIDKIVDLCALEALFIK